MLPLYMLKIIQDLLPLGATLLGDGFHKGLEYINKIIPLDIIKVKSGTKLETWTVPNEWIVRDAWVKFNGKKILDYKTNPLCLMVYSSPFRGIVSKEELKQHLTTAEEINAVAYHYSFYEPKWGFSMPKDQMWRKVGAGKPVQEVNGTIELKPENVSQYEDLLQDGEYEVFIDTEFKPGNLEIGVHTLPGVWERTTKEKDKDREILLFAHLDHPYQANDNLSGVATLIDLTKQIKCNHRVKLIFCAETIGSIAYALTQDVSKVDFMIALDCVGNDNSVLVQKAWDKEARINFAVNFAITGLGISYRKGEFRFLIGSDEYIFNDPKINIPGVMLSRWPYKEYHTDNDTVEVVKEEKLKEIQQIILKTIEIYEKDFIPVRKFRGPLMRSKYGWQYPDKLINRSLDYLIYGIDGKTWLSRLVIGSGIQFDLAHKLLTILKQDGLIDRIDVGEVSKSKTPRKKS